MTSSHYREPAREAPQRVLSFVREVICSTLMASGSASSAPGRLLCVDALRGIASLWVVLFHLYEANHVKAFTDLLPSPVHWLLRIGWIGVPVFFVLSGFVITHSVSRHRVDGGFVWRFALRRSIRLDPPYWASMAIVVSLGLLATVFVPGKVYDIPDARRVLVHLVYLQEILGAKPINVIYWTLCLEIQFYLLFCLLMWGVHSLQRDSGDRRPLAWVFGPAMFLAALWPVFGLKAPWPGAFLPYWHGFLLGMAARFVTAGVAPVSVFYGYAGLIALGTVRAAASGDTEGTLLTGACVLTAVLLTEGGRRSKLGSWLSCRPLQLLGKISYSLYLIHVPVTGAAFNVAYRLTRQTPGAEAFWLVAVVGIDIAAAYVLWWLVERTSTNLSQRIRFERPAPTAARPAA